MPNQYVRFDVARRPEDPRRPAGVTVPFVIERRSAAPAHIGALGIAWVETVVYGDDARETLARRVNELLAAGFTVPDRGVPLMFARPVDETAPTGQPADARERP